MLERLGCLKLVLGPSPLGSIICFCMIDQSASVDFVFCLVVFQSQILTKSLSFISKKKNTSLFVLNNCDVSFG